MTTVYRSGLTDSSRWAGFAFRPGDIVISTPSKCGTTWVQMICALLIFQDADLPAPLTTLSPWLDMNLRPLPEVVRLLAAQRHRRFIKTHTPLDGLPWVDGVHYVTVGRDPRDVAVSMDHHRANLNGDVLELPSASSMPATQRERVLRWMYDPRSPARTFNSLRGLVWHLAGAWARRHESTVTLLHYNDLCRDLEGRMRYLAARLDLTVPDALWPALVEAATFDRMRARATDVVPDERLGLFADERAFFRSGKPDQWRTTLTDRDLDGYQRLVRSLAPPDLTAWLEGGQPRMVRA